MTSVLSYFQGVKLHRQAIMPKATSVKNSQEVNSVYAVIINKGESKQATNRQTRNMKKHFLLFHEPFTECVIQLINHLLYCSSIVYLYLYCKRKEKLLL